LSRFKSKNQTATNVTKAPVAAPDIATATRTAGVTPCFAFSAVGTGDLLLVGVPVRNGQRIATNWPVTMHLVVVNATVPVTLQLRKSKTQPMSVKDESAMVPTK
jgi:predicted dinucleotide-binding enzyme